VKSEPRNREPEREADDQKRQRQDACERRTALQPRAAFAQAAGPERLRHERVEAEEQAELGLVLDLALDRGTDRELLDEHFPGIAHGLLEAE